MKPIDYFLELTEGRVPIPKNLNIRAIEEVVESNAFTLAIQSIRFPPRGGLESARVHRNAGRFSRAQCALEILG